MSFLTKYPAKKQKVFLLNKFSLLRHPLTSLSLELTNACNYNCRHCYGSFGQQKPTSQIKTAQIIKMLPELSQLHTIHVSLTGGECTLNDNFNEIANILLENGFDLWVLTNSSNFAKICTLVESTNCHINVKVSLDGTENIHDYIRQSIGSYKSVIKLLDYLSSKSNVTLYISTVLMKSNYDNYRELKNMIKSKYPSAIHRTDIIVPSGNAIKKECFTLNEIAKIHADYPELFSYQKQNNNIGCFRCSGGITQATISATGRIKICNLACNKRFSFAHNVFEKGLLYCLLNCGKNIDRYHEEYTFQTSKCLDCAKKR